MTSFSTGVDILSDADIRALISVKFAGHGGGARLARALGVSESTAGILRAGGGNLAKAATLFGYAAIDEEPGMWRKSPRKSSPVTAGRQSWSTEVLCTVRSRLADGDTVGVIAKAMEIEPQKLRNTIARHKLRQDSEPGDDDAAYASAALDARNRGDIEGERRILAEAAARKAGGDIFAHMSASLSSPQAHSDFRKAAEMAAARDAAEVSNGGYVYASALPEYSDDEEVDAPVRRKKRRAAK